MAGDAGTGGAVNPNVSLSGFSVDDIMFDLEHFFSHPTRGAGIDLYWVKRPFVPLEGPAIMGRPNAYRYTGDMVYTPKPGTAVTGDLDGSAWISSDTEYKATVPLIDYQAIFPPANGMFQFMMEQNRYPEQTGFVLLLLASRHAEVARKTNNDPYKVYPLLKNAFAILDTDAPGEPHQQGAVICLAGISEERPFNALINGVTHYTSGEFLDIVGFCIAHELFHLLCGLSHDSTPNAVLGVGPYLSNLIASPTELLRVNLKSKRGVTQ